MAITNWQSTHLFNHLKALKKDKLAESMITLLKSPQVMDKIVKILSKGGSTPKNFTLHDEEHSFRVAEKMWELIPVSTQKKLSAYEVGLLLLSAYLHDIGMSPEFDKVETHKKYLTTDVKKGLTEEEASEFQKWIDNDPRSLSIDIRKEKVEDLKSSNYILSYYIRHKHNDWSGVWIKNNLDKISLEQYPGWIDDLIKVCKSHHYGIDVLKGGGFDPKPVGSNSKVHVRYLAMCLRVADVMENDPERTPEVIMQHRDISQDSLTYWLKDHRFELRRDQNKFTIYARPEKAFLHKAIEETTQYIENELKLCTELVKLKPLAQSSFADLKEYEWAIEPYLHRDISPKDNLYEYIQGAFRPNTSKILELLGGNQLYGDAIWAYRELIQNAFDAIKERMAYLIINEDKDPKEYLAKLGDLYTIDIFLEEKNGGVWLICKDQGVGMTKSIIEKYFLESGTSKRHEISELERRCKENGFNFGRTGQFGIGVLSYFMIAEKIIVKTKREFNTGYRDEESIAWQFEINGTHDFGELSKYNKNISGTEIALKLKPEIAESISSWDTRFSEFLKDEISKTPCNINYISKISNQKQSVKFGWTNLVGDMKKKITDNFAEDTTRSSRYEDDYVPLYREKEKLKKDLLASEALVEMSKIVDFLFDEGEIEGVGTYRIHIPYFKLNKGYSFCYLKEKILKDSHNIQQIKNGYFWFPNFEGICISLKGIKIEEIIVDDDPNSDDISSFLEDSTNAYIELNIEKIRESNLSVSRHSLQLDEKFILVKEYIETRVKDLLNMHKKLFDNCYGSLNYEITKATPTNEYWAFGANHSVKNNNYQSLLWEKIKYPVCPFHYFARKWSALTYENKELAILDKLKGVGEKHTAEWFKSINGSYKLGILKDLGIIDLYLPILVNITGRTLKEYESIFRKIELPKEWENILLINFNYEVSSNGWYINERSKYFKLFDLSVLLQIATKEKSITKSDLVDEKCCFVFLLYAIMKYKNDSWIGLCEKKKPVIQHVFKQLRNAAFYLFIGYEVVKVSYSKWEVLDGVKMKKIIPNFKKEEYIVEGIDKKNKYRVNHSSKQKTGPSR
jgi:hypothetical protein